MFPACIPGEIKRRTMSLRRIPPRMRIKQAAWKSSVGVRELLVWQRNCQHIKIAWVLNKTETCTIYTCQKETEWEREKVCIYSDMENFHSHLLWSVRVEAWCQTEFHKVTCTTCSHDRGALNVILWLDKPFVYSSSVIMPNRQSFEGWSYVLGHNNSAQKLDKTVKRLNVFDFRTLKQKLLF